MNTPIRKVSVFVALMLLALIVNLNYVQVIHANAYRDNAANRRVQLDEYKRQRGAIIVSGGQIAESVRTTDELTYLRKYSAGPVYANLTGYDSFYYGQTGLEDVENSVLSGDDDRLFVQRLRNLLTGRDPQGGNVVLTINKQAQLAAAQALGDRRGSVVAIDPSTGAILAAVSSPSYDPNKLSSHQADTVTSAYTAYNNDTVGTPLLNRAFQQTYPPGSVFKVVVSAAALKSGILPSTQIPAKDKITLPGTTTTLENFDGERCANGKTDTLDHALTISCNTAFAQLGINLGQQAITDQAALFGIDGSSFSVPSPVVGSTLGPIDGLAQLGQSSIGQLNVRITPLQAAMISAAVANHGSLMRPYLVAEEQAPNLALLSRTSPTLQSQTMSPVQAAALTQMMTDVVNRGTGTAAQIAGVQVAGKTGTADNGPEVNGKYLKAPDAWFTGFAPAAAPKIAVAVVLENGGVDGNETTGGLAAAPVAKAVIQAYLGSPSAQ